MRKGGAQKTVAEGWTRRYNEASLKLGESVENDDTPAGRFPLKFRSGLRRFERPLLGALGARRRAQVRRRISGGHCRWCDHVTLGPIDRKPAHCGSKLLPHSASLGQCSLESE